MKRIMLTSVLAAVIAAISGTASHAQVTLTDLGAIPPSPGSNDVYMLDNLNTYPDSEPAGLNYYADGGGGNYFPGQIFTTGSNASGYTLNTLTVLPWCCDGGGLTSTYQDYTLNLYSYTSSNSTATLIASYTSQPFLVVDEDYIRFSNLGAALLPNTEYAWSFQRDGDGWVQMGAENVITPVPGGFASSLYNGSGNLIDTNDAAVLIPLPGGVIGTNNTAPGYQAPFDVGLSPITTLTINPPTLATPGNVYPAVENVGNVYSNGTAVTINSGAVFGATPYFYQWQTDGGTGNTPTNILGSTATNLTVTLTSNTNYVFDVVVSNNVGQVVTSAVASVTIVLPDQAAPLFDDGTNLTASPYYLSISNLVGGGTGDNLNYFDNDLGAPPGNIFTTGSNPQGYLLTSAQVDTGGTGFGTGGGAWGGTTTPQSYYLYLYTVNPSMTKAQLVQVYTNSSFFFTWSDWLFWTGLNTTLKPNTTYAYTFANDNTGYAQMNTSPSPVANSSVGVACLISPKTGDISLDANNNSGVFALGLTAIGAAPIPQPFAGPISVSPTGTQLSGTTITLTENTLGGAATLHYLWESDGGTGGPLTLVSNSLSSSLVLNTTGWTPGAYTYDVIVSNTSGTSTAVPVSFTLIYANGTGVLTDIGTNTPTPGANDISQLLSTAGEPAGLNYYFDNGTPPGQTFTTGPNALGYNLNAVDILLAGGSGGPLPPGGQGYFLRIYSVNTNTTTATLYATYESQTNFVLTTGVNDTDWVRFSGFSVPLAANGTYAWSFGRDHSQGYDAGWDELASDSANLYLGGQAATIPTAGGTYAVDNAAGSYDATFDLSLSLGSVTLNEQYNGTQIELQWSTGVLLQATSLGGPWTTNALATSPYFVTPTAPEMFYRVKVQ
jgi:hypothetical protein